MKNRNVLILLIALAIGSVFSSSCKKSFLEKPKGGNVTVDTIFDTQNQAQQAVALMYHYCVRTGFAKDYNQCRPDDITDEVYIIHPDYDWASGINNAGDYSVGSMGTENTIDRSLVSDDAFGGHYLGIRQANLVLKNIDQVKNATDAWKTDQKGQALFCRALQHFELFKLYGGIPIVTKPLDGTGSIDIPRSTVSAVVDSIVSWCDQAVPMLPATRTGADYGRATSIAALALKARLLLYAASPLYNTPPSMTSLIAADRFNDGRDSMLCYPTYDKERWKAAADASKDVLDKAQAAGYGLYNTGVSKTTGETYGTLGDYEAVSNVYANKELILVNTMTMAEGGADGTFWSNRLYSKIRYGGWSVKNNVPVEFLQQYEKADGTPFTLAQSGTDLPVDIQALNLEPRFYQTIAYDGMYYNSSASYLQYYKKGDFGTDGALSSSDAGVDGFAFETYKFVARINNFDDTHFAWPVFRLAEFYLSYAEAINEYSGPTADAVTDLNLIRKRAGLPDKTNLTDQATFRTAVHHERTIEFAYEDLRYNDLTRWLDAGTVLNGPLHGVVTTARKAPDGSLKRSWAQVIFVSRIFPVAKYYYVPFPSSEISKKYLGNKNWDGQNPGW